MMAIVHADRERLQDVGGPDLEGSMPVVDFFGNLATQNRRTGDVTVELLVERNVPLWEACVFA